MRLVLQVCEQLAGKPTQLRGQGSSNQVCSLEQYNTSNILEFVIKGSWRCTYSKTKPLELLVLLSSKEEHDPKWKIESSKVICC